MNIHNPNSNSTITELENLFEDTPYREAIALYREKILEEVERNFAEREDIKKLNRRIEIVEEQVYFAQTLIESIKAGLPEVGSLRYKESKNVVDYILRVMEDSSFEL